MTNIEGKITVEQAELFKLNQELKLNLVEIGRGKLTLFHRPSKDKHIRSIKLT